MGDKICVECRKVFINLDTDRKITCSLVCWQKRKSRHTTRSLNRKSAKSFNGLVRYFKLVDDIHDLGLIEVH